MLRKKMRRNKKRMENGKLSPTIHIILSSAISFYISVETHNTYIGIEYMDTFIYVQEPRAYRLIIIF